MRCIVVPLVFLQLRWYPPSQDLSDVIVVEGPFALGRNKGSNTVAMRSISFQEAITAALP